MAEGIAVEVEDGLARIEFLDRSKKGDTVAALLKAGGRGAMKIDSGGTRRTYIVPEAVAESVGLIDAPKPRRKTSTAKAKTDTTS